LENNSNPGVGVRVCKRDIGLDVGAQVCAPGKLVLSMRFKRTALLVSGRHATAGEFSMSYGN
jgi:hypothetical protein